MSSALGFVSSARVAQPPLSVNSLAPVSNQIHESLVENVGGVQI